MVENKNSNIQKEISLPLIKCSVSSKQLFQDLNTILSSVFFYRLKDVEYYVNSHVYFLTPSKFKHHSEATLSLNNNEILQLQNSFKIHKITFLNTYQNTLLFKPRLAVLN